MKNLFFIGVGGSGMKPLAVLSARLGYTVEGLDSALQPQKASSLEEEGIRTFLDHRDVDFERYDTVVYSSAIRYDNPALLKARQSDRGQREVIHRMDLLNRLVSRCPVRIGVAGTHGKTSTASMIGWVLQELGMDPDIIVGGHPRYLEEGVRAGGGHVAVFETDESDGSFLSTNATLRLVLNVDADHLDYYGTLEALQDAFDRFMQSGQLVAVFGGDPYLKGVLENGFAYDELEDKQSTADHLIAFDVLEYGQTPESNEDSDRFPGEAGDYRKSFISMSDSVQVSPQSVLQLPIPGKHFARNAMGVVALLDTAISRGLLPGPVDYSMARLVEALNRFPGVERRMEHIGSPSGIFVYDDYGHHPTEIQAVLAALRIRHPDSRIIVVFQPHRYTRTAEHAGAFARVLSDGADGVYVCPVYSAGETPIEGVSSRSILDLLEQEKRAGEITLPDFGPALGDLESGDVLLIQGAGDISYHIREYLSMQV